MSVESGDAASTESGADIAKIRRLTQRRWAAISAGFLDTGNNSAGLPQGPGHGTWRTTSPERIPIVPRPGSILALPVSPERGARGRSAAKADGEPRHDPEKWTPVFRKDHAQTKEKRAPRDSISTDQILGR